VTGSFLPKSDIDISLIKTSTSATNESHSVTEKSEICLLSELAKWILHQNIAHSIKFVPTARVPLIKLKHLSTGIKVDISFQKQKTQQESCQSLPSNTPNTVDQLLLDKMEKIVKLFLSQRRLNKPYYGFLPSYAVSVLVSHYLNRLASQSDWKEKIPNIGQMLLGFFDYFGNNFDFTRDGISATGTTFPNEEVGKPHIRDPSNHDNNLAESTFDISSIIKVFQLAHSELTSTCSNSTSEMKYCTTLLSDVILWDDTLVLRGGGSILFYRLKRAIGDLHPATTIQ